MELNKRIKELRENQGLNQKQASEIFEVSLSAYQKYERDKQSIKPSIEVLLKIADYYNVTLDYLFDRTIDNTADAVINSSGLTGFQKSIYASYIYADKETRQHMVDIANTIIELSEKV